MKLKELLLKLEELKSLKGDDIDVGVVVDVAADEEEQAYGIYYSMTSEGELLSADVDGEETEFIGFLCEPKLEIFEEE